MIAALYVEKNGCYYSNPKRVALLGNHRPADY